MWDIIFVIMPPICGNFGNIEWPSSLVNCQHFQPWHQREKLGSYLLEIVSIFMFLLLSALLWNQSVILHSFRLLGSGRCRCCIRCTGMYPLPASLSASARFSKIKVNLTAYKKTLKLYFLFRFKLLNVNWLVLNCLFLR